MPRTVCFSQWKVRASSSKVAPFFRLSIAITWAILLPSRGPPPSFALAVFLALGAFLAGVAFLVALPLAGPPLAGRARVVAFFSGLRLRGLFRLRLLGFAQTLDALPDAGDSSLGALKTLHGRDASQAVKNRDQSLRRPRFGQFHQFLLAAEAVEGRCGCGGGLFLARKRNYFVRFVDSESRHNRCPFCHALRGHHMNPSEALESKGLSGINRPWGRTGDVPDADVSKCQEMSQN